MPSKDVDVPSGMLNIVTNLYMREKKKIKIVIYEPILLSNEVFFNSCFLN